MYPIHLIFCLVIVAKNAAPLVEAALESLKIDDKTKTIFTRIKGVITDSTQHMLSKSMLVLSLVTLSKKEIRTFRAFSKNHVKDVEGASSIVIALFVLNGLPSVNDMLYVVKLWI